MAFIEYVQYEIRHRILKEVELLQSIAPTFFYKNYRAHDISPRTSKHLRNAWQIHSCCQNVGWAVLLTDQCPEQFKAWPSADIRPDQRTSKHFLDIVGNLLDNNTLLVPHVFPGTHLPSVSQLSFRCLNLLNVPTVLVCNAFLF